MAKGGEKKNTKINPKMQTNNHCHATNVKHVSDYSFVATDDYGAWLQEKNAGVTWLLLIYLPYVT